MADEDFDFHRLESWKQGGFIAPNKASLGLAGLGPVCLKKRFPRHFQLIPDDDIEIINTEFIHSDQNSANSVSPTSFLEIGLLRCVETDRIPESEHHPQLQGEKNTSILSPIFPDDRSRRKKSSLHLYESSQTKYPQTDTFSDSVQKDDRHSLEEWSGSKEILSYRNAEHEAYASGVKDQEKRLRGISSSIFHCKADSLLGPKPSSVSSNPITLASTSSHIPDLAHKVPARSLMLAPCVAKPYLAIPISASVESIRVLDFSFQSLGDEVIVEFAKSLTQQLPLVEEMILRDNRLSDNGLYSILEAITQNDAHSMRKLDMSQNKYGPRSAERLRYHIASENCRLETLAMNQMAISDRDCALLMSAFSSRTSIKVLHMSRNEIGQLEHLKMTQPDFRTGGDAIANVLEKNCALIHLDLSWNYLRLDSSLRLARALGKNKFLERLDVAYNPCGDAGAMMFGEALRQNRTLKMLNVSYNSIGYKGAMVLANVLRKNTILENLHLDGNDIRREGGQALMFATCHRRAHSKCKISMNECSLSMFAIHSSHDQRPASSNDSQSSSANFARSTKVFFSASPITHQETINMPNYPVYTKESARVFNPQEPTGRYFLSMPDPYDRMIAMELLRLATDRKGCHFIRLEHTIRNNKSTRTRTSSMEGEGVKKRAIHLVLSNYRARRRTALDSKVLMNANAKKGKADMSSSTASRGLDSLFSDISLSPSGTIDYKAVISALNKVGLSPSDQDLANVLQGLEPDQSVDKVEYTTFIIQAIFDFIDTNHCGRIDFNELKRAFRYLGIENVDDKDVREAVSRYDLSGDGEMEGAEFVEFMKERLLDEVLASTLSGFDRGNPINERMQLLDASTHLPWHVPEDGSLEIDFMCTRQSIGDTEEARWSSRIPDDGLGQLIDNILFHGSTKAKMDEMLMVAIHDSELQFTASQAYRIMEACDGLCQEERKLMMLSMLLPQMLTTKDTRRLVSQTLTSKERYLFKAQMGSLYSIMIGNPTAHYELDLCRSQDRLTLSKLAGIAQSEKEFSRHRSGRSDTSQHGNWENFRNERLDGKPFVYTTSFLHVMPTRGKLCFDYVSTKRPQRDAVAISDQRFKQLIDILRPEDPLQQNLAATSSNSVSEAKVNLADPLEKKIALDDIRMVSKSMRRSTLANAGPLLRKQSRLPYQITEAPKKVSETLNVKLGRSNKPLLAKIKGRVGKRASMPFLNESWKKSLAQFTMSNPTIESVRMKIIGIETAISERCRNDPSPVSTSP
ncbi:unnamed protein product [Albugo candida]|uniref:EF-hand domain-containing protein n=1 Tax=Albugo candida TaxID=65357 RepID=A0A024G1V5_9STRA|nr:unnamed protein product [Albugo candida]|eukprot:CCI40288.1 unnamed protein product [Albugo candida]